MQTESVMHFMTEKKTQKVSFAIPTAEILCPVIEDNYTKKALQNP